MADALARILDLEEVDVGPRPGDPGGRASGPVAQDIFRGNNLVEGTFSPRVFGGQLIGQALVAASRTVSLDLPVHSLHANFLLPGDPTKPFIYAVRRVRDGRSFATRSVTASQQGDTVFLLTASFQRPEEGFEHSAQMPPGVPSPESLPTQEEVYRRYHADPRLPQRYREMLWQRAQIPFPLDVRAVDPVDKVKPEAREARQLSWMRAPMRLGDDPSLHRCIVAYGSDFSLLETALLPHGAAVPSRKVMAASLDHAMWFHRPFRADEWILYEMESTNASGGRGLAFGKLFNQKGELIATTAQEGLIRQMTGDRGTRAGLPRQAAAPTPPQARL